MFVHSLKFVIVVDYVSANSCICIMCIQHTVINLSVVVHALPVHILICLLVNELLLLRYVNWFTNFRDLDFNVISVENAKRKLHKDTTCWIEY